MSAAPLSVAPDPRAGHPAPTLGADRVTPVDVARLARGTGAPPIAPEVADRIAAARRIIDAIVASGEPAYGITRGLGPLRDQVIPPDRQHDFQLFVFASHDAAVGPLLSREEARALMLARLAVMARGNSGASQALVDGLTALLAHDITPAVPGHSSVGAADLAALTSVGAVIVGQGRVLGPDGVSTVPGEAALAAVGLAPTVLEAKDAHALVVANSASVGIGSLMSVRLDRYVAASDLVAAATFEALTANTGVLRADVLAARPHAQAQAAAARIRALLADGDLGRGEVRASSLQDPLSVRTVPQVHGMLAEHADLLREILTVELNAMPENPYLDLANDSFVSNGNFSSARLAVELDAIRIAIAHVALMCERRIAGMIRMLRSGRPLLEQIDAVVAGTDPVVPVILAQTASSLLTTLRQLAAPATPLGTVVGDGVEDHNAQAYVAVRLTRESIEVAETLTAIEAVLACGVTLLPGPAQSRRRGAVLTQLQERTRELLEARGTTGTTATTLEAVLLLVDELVDDVPASEGCP